MFDLKFLRNFIMDILREFFGEQEKQKYAEYTDVKGFCKISGISENDFDKKLTLNADFRNCIYKLDGGNKRYIHTESGLEALRNMFEEARR